MAVLSNSERHLINFCLLLANIVTKLVINLYDCKMIKKNHIKTIQIMF